MSTDFYLGAVLIANYFNRKLTQFSQKKSFEFDNPKFFDRKLCHFFIKQFWVNTFKLIFLAEVGRFGKIFLIKPAPVETSRNGFF